MVQQSAHRLRYPAANRIKKRSEFLRVQEIGSKHFSRHFVIAIAASPTPHPRLGIVITKKLDKRAVVRNLLKRRVREVFRHNRHRLSENFDIVIIARKNAHEITFKEIGREILGALYHNGYLAN